MDELQSSTVLRIKAWIAALPESGILITEYDIDFKQVKDEDWLNNWKKFFKPIDIGEQMRVRPPWEEKRDFGIDLVINPKMGFGTGQHATTYLCLKNMLSESLKNKKIIDIGAGSGILGAGALLLGASWADLVENDEQAIESCQETLDINHVAEKGKVYLESIFDAQTNFENQNYDLALINIIAEVIVQILDIPWVQKIPVLFLSGIIVERKEMVIEKALQIGYILEKEETLEEWVFLKIKKNK